MQNQNLIKNKVKQTISVKVEKEVEGIVPNWDNVPVGTKFTAYIENYSDLNPYGTIYVEGRIQKENDQIFLCQDDKNGQDAADKLGYPYSWSLGDGSEPNLKRNGAIITSLTLDPQFKPILEWDGDVIAGYTPNINRGHVKFGCRSISNEDIRKLVSMLID